MSANFQERAGITDIARCLDEETAAMRPLFLLPDNRSRPVNAPRTPLPCAAARPVTCTSGVLEHALSWQKDCRVRPGAPNERRHASRHTRGLCVVAVVSASLACCCSTASRIWRIGPNGSVNVGSREWEWPCTLATDLMHLQRETLVRTGGFAVDEANACSQPLGVSNDGAHLRCRTIRDSTHRRAGRRQPEL